MASRIRAGLPYGPVLPESPDDGTDRGLAVFFGCADLERQFEFVLKEWVNAPKFQGLQHDKGPDRGRPDGTYKPKLRPVRQAISSLTWAFTGLAGCRSGYVKVSGIVAPMSWKACRWALVGSVSIGMVTWVPVNRTWLRVRVARCSSRLRKLR